MTLEVALSVNATRVDMGTGPGECANGRKQTVVQILTRPYSLRLICFRNESCVSNILLIIFTEDQRLRRDLIDPRTTSGRSEVLPNHVRPENVP